MVGFVHWLLRRTGPYLICTLIVTTSTTEACCVIEGEEGSGRELALFVARDGGFLKKHNLKEDFRTFATAEILRHIKGDWSVVGVLPATVAMDAVRSDQTLIIFAVLSFALDYSVWAKPGITKLPELKGKKIGVTAKNSFDFIGSYNAFVAKGIEPTATKTEFLPAPAGASTTVLAKETEAVVVPLASEEEPRKLGWNKVYSFADLGAGIPTSVLITSKSYALSGTDTLRRLLAALREGAGFARSQEDPTKAIIAKTYKVSGAVDLERWYAIFVRDGLTGDVRPTKEAFARLLALSRKAGVFAGVSEDIFIDDAILKALYGR